MEILSSFKGRLFGMGSDGSLIVNNDTDQLIIPTTRIVDATAATLTVTKDEHAGRTVTLNRAAGIAVTLPAATGTGDKYRFLIGTTVTSNATTIKAASASDAYQGNAFGVSDGSAAVLGWKATAGTSDTVSFDGSTTGGYAGDVVEIEDIASGLWQVVALIAQTGTEATPFSATVS